MTMLPTYYLVHNAKGEPVLFFGSAPAPKR